MKCCRQTQIYLAKLRLTGVLFICALPDVPGRPEVSGLCAVLGLPDDVLTLDFLPPAVPGRGIDPLDDVRPADLKPNGGGL